MGTTEGEAEATVESPRDVRSQVAEADKVNGADGKTPTNRHLGSRHGRKGTLACLQDKKLCGKRSWTLNGKKKG